MLHGPIIASRSVRLMSRIVITDKLRNYIKPIACRAPRADAAARENHGAVKVTQAFAAVSRRPRPDQRHFQTPPLSPQRQLLSSCKGGCIQAPGRMCPRGKHLREFGNLPWGKRKQLGNAAATFGADVS